MVRGCSQSFDLPSGRAWLEFEVTSCDDGSMIRQTAIFDPVGLLGILYWYSVYPLHQFVFEGMLRNIANAAERETRLADVEIVPQERVAVTGNQTL
ncbi:MAG: DUF2867 domain-containing protein [Planctomycetes bacterium]|nr:DUF2867 domain-containing protein [Planctomycetota bacterium]